MRRISALMALFGASVIAPTLYAGPASGTFSVNAIYFDTSAFPGRGGGIGSSFDPAYQASGGNNFPPSTGAIFENPVLEFDTYVAFGGQPSNESTAAITPPATPPGFDANNGFFDDNTRFSGAIFSGPGGAGLSEINPVTGVQSFFFARLTLPQGSEPSGVIAIDILGEVTNVFDIQLFDPAAGAGMGSRGFREFRVVGQKTLSDVELPTSARSSGATALFDVYDFYIELVPAPGAAAVLGLSGLTLVRRRRRASA